MKKFTIKKDENWRNAEGYYTNGSWLAKAESFDKLFPSQAKKLKEIINNSEFCGDSQHVKNTADKYFSANLEETGYKPIKVISQEYVNEGKSEYLDIVIRIPVKSNILNPEIKIRIQAKYESFLFKGTKTIKVKDAVSPIYIDDNRILMPWVW